MLESYGANMRHSEFHPLKTHLKYEKASHVVKGILHISGNACSFSNVRFCFEAV